jgi:hypothetical protein
MMIVKKAYFIPLHIPAIVSLSAAIKLAYKSVSAVPLILKSCR